MSNVLEFINDAFAKAGLSENETVKGIFTNEGVQKLKDLVLPPEISNIAKEKLINLESAKSHPGISAHFKNSYYGTIDNAISESLKGILDDATIQELAKEKTEIKFKKALDKALELAKSQSKGNETDEIKKLQLAIAENQRKYEADILSTNSKFENANNTINELKKEFALSSLISGYKLRSDLDANDVLLLLKNKINQNVQSANARLSVDSNGVISLKNKDNDTDYFDIKKGKVVSLKDFIDDVVSGSGLIAVSDTSNKNQNQNQTFNFDGNKKSAGIAHLERRLNK